MDDAEDLVLSKIADESERIRKLLEVIAAQGVAILEYLERNNERGTDIANPRADSRKNAAHMLG